MIMGWSQVALQNMSYDKSRLLACHLHYSVPLQNVSDAKQKNLRHWFLLAYLSTQPYFWPKQQERYLSAELDLERVS